MNSSSVSSSSEWTAVGRGGRHGAGAFSSDAAAAFGGRRAGAGAGRRTADAYQPPSMLRRYDDAPKPAPAPVPFEQAFPSLGGAPRPVAATAPAAKKATTFASLARKCQETDDAAEIRRKIEEEAKARKRMLEEYDARMFARNSASSSYTPYTSSRLYTATAEDDEDNYNTNDDIETDAYGGSASGGAYRAAQYEMEERFVYEDDYAASNEDDTDDRRW